MIGIIAKISDMLNKACEFLLTMTGFSFVMVMTIGIVFRYMIGSALSWSDACARYLFIYGTMLAMPVAFKNEGHISLTFLTDKFHGKARTIVEIFILIVCLVLCVMTTKAGFDGVGLVANQKAASMPIKMSWVYIAIPLGMIVATIQIVCLIIIKAASIGEEET